MKRLAFWGAVLLQGVALSWAGEIEFVETFALSPDRAAALKQLIPGTEDYYYYNALHLLNTEQFEKVEHLLKPWVQRHGETPRVWEIRTRQALLTYDKHPQNSLDYLRGRFGIQYPHRKEELNAEPNLPIIARSEAHRPRNLPEAGAGPARQQPERLRRHGPRLADRRGTQSRTAPAAAVAAAAARLSEPGRN